MESASDHGTSIHDERATVLTFDLEERRYCVEAASVVSVLGIADETLLSGTGDPWNAGTLTVAGERVRVVDLPRVFGSSRRTADRVTDPNLLVLDVPNDEDWYYGWLIDDSETVWLNEQAMHD
ncbi:chemotaxis protein CheW [Natrinema caseinilyticum]|uniref:chemotaxis protein CheW n=1 Tax=Natrinema caseinilyticum TaxID=2961570 RepID=UPI0020C4D86A|nr:chemotaxis protein CheW [Natrinema caseinilyticum]